MFRWGKTVKKRVASVHVKKVYGGEGLQLHSFLTSAEDGVEWLTTRPDGFTACSHRTGRLMDPPRTVLDILDNTKSLCVVGNRTMIPRSLSP